MLEYFVPISIVFLGLIAMIIYVLAISLRETTKQIARMNEQLMIMVGTKDGNEAMGRALVASAKLPKKGLPGVAKKKEPEKPKKGLQMQVGYK